MSKLPALQPDGVLVGWEVIVLALENPIAERSVYFLKFQFALSFGGAVVIATIHLVHR